MGELSKDEKVAINFENVLDSLNIPSQQECLDKILLILKDCEPAEFLYTEDINNEETRYNIWRITLEYAITFCIYNINQMSVIYGESNDMTLNDYNDIDNKDASKKLKNKFEKSAFKYKLKDNCLFYNDDNIKWKFTLFDVLGIELRREYFKSEQGRRKFYECFDIPLLLNPTEKEENIKSFREKYINEKEIEILYEAICKEEKLPSVFFTAKCYFERKKGSDEEKKKYMEIASLEEEGDIWKISKYIFMSYQYYQDRIKWQLNDCNDFAYDYIPLNEAAYQKLKGYSKNEKTYNIKIKLYDIRRMPKKFKYTFTKTIQYKLYTNFPKTIFEPIYDATFSSITKNIFFSSPREIETLSQSKLYSFYSEYYSKLNGRLSTIQNASEECYWLSEKLYGINFLKKVVEYITMRDGVGITNGEKVSTKIHLTSEFREFVNRLVKISIPEMQFFYWELYIESGTDIESALEAIDILDIDEVENLCVQKLKESIENDSIDDKKEFWDQYKREYVIKYLESYQNVKFIGELKKDINNIYNKPDIDFLEKKENQKYINCICSDTEWFFKYVENLNDTNNFGMWEE